MFEVRPATPEEYPAIIKHAEKFWALTEYAERAEFDPLQCLETVTMCAQQGLLLSAVYAGEVIGFVAGVVTPMIASNALSGTEVAWWVEPEFQGNGVGKALLGAAEVAAREAGAVFWTMIVMEAVDPERAAAVYERAGYHQSERAFTKVI